MQLCIKGKSRNMDTAKQGGTAFYEDAEAMEPQP